MQISLGGTWPLIYRMTMEFHLRHPCKEQTNRHLLPVGEVFLPLEQLLFHRCQLLCPFICSTDWEAGMPAEGFRRVAVREGRKG